MSGAAQHRRSRAALTFLAIAGGIQTAITFVWNAIGGLQQAQQLLDDRNKIIRNAWALLLWPYTGPAVVVVALLCILVLRIWDRQQPTTRLASNHLSAEDGGTVQVFAHEAALRQQSALPLQIEDLLRGLGWRVEPARTSLAIHAMGVWVHGGTAATRGTLWQLLAGSGFEARIDDREEGGPLQVIVGASATAMPGPTVAPGNQAAPALAAAPEQPTDPRLEVFDWREGQPHDTRPEYRRWAYVSFRFGSPRHERGRAYIELENGDRPPAVIAGHGFFAHEVDDLRPGTTYTIWVCMTIDNFVELDIDQKRYGHLVGYDPQWLPAGTYLTDEAFMDATHRQPLPAGRHVFKVVLSLGDRTHRVEFESTPREFLVD